MCCVSTTLVIPVCYALAIKFRDEYNWIRQSEQNFYKTFYIPYSAKQLKINKHRQDIHAVVMLFASWLSAQQLWPPYLGWQGHNSLIAIVSYHHDKMWKRKNVSSSDWYWTFDVRRQEIELNHQGPLKMAIG